jgi:hypothetical protein
MAAAVDRYVLCFGLPAAGVTGTVAVSQMPFWSLAAAPCCAAFSPLGPARILSIVDELFLPLVQNYQTTGS